ncbi:hypothetical protein QL285_054730 [Trifolium repens]|jgi:hypothetical protein|nr:hypothetical protein QL285_054730 [Trifolium repens]
MKTSTIHIKETNQNFPNSINQRNFPNQNFHPNIKISLPEIENKGEFHHLKLKQGSSREEREGEWKNGGRWVTSGVVWWSSVDVEQRKERAGARDEVGRSSEKEAR